ncbi:hypothetical protein LSH36_123g03037 [Paralvinella palmiformis]|uniref:SUEL-type lectin domain-containing protein n=1 Tax=Paralvinella palmiformis TaxID=53620 RepID=A0AAD9JXL4_9ANNE|nr:hypothetical protein LSH36_123g03037 [Paralvinella palmiformis]
MRRLAVRQPERVVGCLPPDGALTLCFYLSKSVISSCIRLFEGAKEYCQLEGFDATCPPDHVILITKAKYGRMKLGRCLTRDYYVGCSDDVTSILHERCSGKSNCYVSIPDPALYEKQHCPKDLVSYLDAEYSCLQVTYFANVTCANNQRRIHIPKSGGFIAGYQPFSTYHLSPPSSQCQLALRAARGQTINVTLYEFHSDPDQTSTDVQGQQYQCVVLATIKERLTDSYRENVVCSRGGHFQQLVYSSKTHEIIIDINQRMDGGRGQRRFLLQYQAVGCRDPNIPDDMTQHRRGDQLDVRCNNTGQVWHLVCRGNSWVGEFGNCTVGYLALISQDLTPKMLAACIMKVEALDETLDSPTNLSQTTSHDRLMNHATYHLRPSAFVTLIPGRHGNRFVFYSSAGIVMAIVVGIVLGIMIGFCLLLVVYNVRRKRKKAAGARASGIDRPGSQLANKYPDTTYNVSDPMLPGNLVHPDLTVDKGCHVMCDVTGTMARGRDRDHVYEKPQSGMEVQCLLSQVKAAESAHPMLTLDPVDGGDYGCHLHRQTTWSQRGEKFEMMPPPPSCIVQT